MGRHAAAAEARGAGGGGHHPIAVRFEGAAQQLEVERIVVDGEDLLFRSAGYFVQAGHLKFTLPAFLTPGALTVTHTDLGSGEFQFALEIVHPRFGMLVHQSAVFREATP